MRFVYYSDSLKAVEIWKRYLRLDNSKIVDTFGGLLKSTLECTHCGHCSTTFEPFWDLSLPIPDSMSHPGKLLLSHCIDLFTKEEFLDGDEMPVNALILYLFPEHKNNLLFILFTFAIFLYLFWVYTVNSWLTIVMGGWVFTVNWNYG